MSQTSGINYKFFYEQEEIRRDEAPTLTSCAFCPKWSYYGTAAEGRKRAEAHRKKKHPDIQRTPRRRAAVPSRIKRAKISQEESDEIALERRRRMFVLGIDE